MSLLVARGNQVAPGWGQLDHLKIPGRQTWRATLQQAVVVLTRLDVEATGCEVTPSSSASSTHAGPPTAAASLASHDPPPLPLQVLRPSQQRRAGLLNIVIVDDVAYTSGLLVTYSSTSMSSALKATPPEGPGSASATSFTMTDSSLSTRYSRCHLMRCWGYRHQGQQKHPNSV